MEANKLRIETDWQTLKNSLLIQNEENGAEDANQWDSHSPFSGDGELTNQISMSGRSPSKEKLEQEIAKLKVSQMFLKRNF